ncbi:MAG: hypothetical protein Ct9H90mV1_0660 [Prasinovirus sp.]|nr:MAG: hypothetical protein Ct9H90mV1_0660 [Prasinovirus sp.]
MCKPIVIPTGISNQTIVTTNKCRIVTISPTDNKSRYVIDIMEDVPEINITPMDINDNDNNNE